MSVIVVTGASRGLGLALVHELLTKDGIQVVAGVRSLQRAGNGLQALQTQHGRRLYVVEMDTSSEDSIKAAAEAVSDKHNSINVIINNAAIVEAFIERPTPFVTTAEEFSSVLATNVIGPFLVAKHFLPLIQASSGTKVIANITSSSGSVSTTAAAAKPGTQPLPALNYIAYNASKAALNMVSAVIGASMKDTGLLTVSIHPGWVQTDMGNAAATVLFNGRTPSLTMQASAQGVLAVIEALTPNQNGTYVDYTGKPFAW